jgi:hypothetical protein
MRIRVLVPHRALEVGVHAAAGDVLNVRGDVAKVLIRDGAAEPTTDPIGRWRNPEATGYAAWSWEELHHETAARGIQGRDRMAPYELVAALEDFDRRQGVA